MTTIWTLTDGKIGMIAQAEGLAQNIAAISSGKVFHATVKHHRFLPPPLSAALGTYQAAYPASPAPQIIIGCGSSAQPVLLKLKKQHRCFAVNIQRPSLAARRYDVIVAPAHDYPHRPPANVICTVGAIGKITPDLLAARRPQARQRFNQPLNIAVIIGGDNRAYRTDSSTLTAQLHNIAALTQATLLITPSRRTPAALINHLQRQFAAPHYIWDGSGDNPYTDILAAADGYCVTADSINMLSEACASGRAVYILPLPTKNTRAQKKFTDFHNRIIQRGNARRFNNEWEFFTAPPLNETPLIAEQIWQRYQ